MCIRDSHWSAVKNGKCDTNLGLIYGPGEKLYSTETSSYKSLLFEQTHLAWAKLKPIKQASPIHLFAEGKLYSSALCKLVNTSHFLTLKIYKHAPLFTFNFCSSRFTTNRLLLSKTNLTSIFWILNWISHKMNSANKYSLCQGILTLSSTNRF